MAGVNFPMWGEWLLSCFLKNIWIMEDLPWLKCVSSYQCSGDLILFLQSPLSRISPPGSWLQCQACTALCPGHRWHCLSLVRSGMSVSLVFSNSSDVLLAVPCYQFSYCLWYKWCRKSLKTCLGDGWALHAGPKASHPFGCKTYARVAGGA